MKRVFTDMTGRETEIVFPPRRIISVVPSQTELLYDLGLQEEVIALTKFCVHPQQWYRNKERIGGTKNLNLEKIKSLAPDLILANKEENTKEEIEELQRHFPVWISDITTVEHALQMIGHIGEITGNHDAAQQLIRTIIENYPDEKTTLRSAAYFIWYRPWMCVGNTTFIHDVLRRCGYKNVFGKESRYPEINEEQLKEADPDVVLLSSEPFPFKEKHITEIKKILPNTEVKLVDGELFSWYGSRMVKACPYLKSFVRK